jgi:hypothetical protein
MTSRVSPFSTSLNIPDAWLLKSVNVTVFMMISPICAAVYRILYTLSTGWILKKASFLPDSRLEMPCLPDRFLETDNWRLGHTFFVGHIK